MCMTYTWFERYELLLKSCNKNMRFLDVWKICCLGSQRSVRTHIRYQTRRHSRCTLADVPARGNDKRTGSADEKEKYFNHRRQRKPLRMEQRTCAPKLLATPVDPMKSSAEIFNASRTCTRKGKKKGRFISENVICGTNVSVKISNSWRL